MGDYINATDTFRPEVAGPCGGLRSFSFASWAWEGVLSAIGGARNADELWECVFADLEGGYFDSGFAESLIDGTDMSVSVQHERGASGEPDMSYLQVARDGEAIVEVAVEGDGETDATSGISVLCDFLWENLYA